MFRVGLKFQFSLGSSVHGVHLLSKAGLGCGGLLPVFKDVCEISCRFSALGQALQFGQGN